MKPDFRAIPMAHVVQCTHKSYSRIFLAWKEERRAGKCEQWKSMESRVRVSGGLNKKTKRREKLFVHV